MAKKTLSFLHKDSLNRECALLWWKKEDYYVGQLRDFPEIQTQAETIDQVETSIRQIFNDAYDFSLPNFTHRIDMNLVELRKRKDNLIGIIICSISALVTIIIFGVMLFSQVENNLCIDDDCKPTSFIYSMLEKIQGKKFWIKQKEVCLKKIKEEKSLAKLKMDPHGYIGELLKDRLDETIKEKHETEAARIKKMLNDARINLLKNMDETERKLFLAESELSERVIIQQEVANQTQIQIDLLRTIHKFEKLIAKIEEKIQK